MEAVAGITALQGVAPYEPAPGSTTSSGSATGPLRGAASFSDVVARSIGDVNARIVDSHIDLQKLAAGEVGNLHQVLIGLEESRLAFQLMLQVRNRLLESYQELMRMQV